MPISIIDQPDSSTDRQSADEALHADTADFATECTDAKNADFAEESGNARKASSMYVRFEDLSGESFAPSHVQVQTIYLRLRTGGVKESVLHKYPSRFTLEEHKVLSISGVCYNRENTDDPSVFGCVPIECNWCNNNEDDIPDNETYYSLSVYLQGTSFNTRVLTDTTAHKVAIIRIDYLE